MKNVFYYGVNVHRDASAYRHLRRWRALGAVVVCKIRVSVSCHCDVLGTYLQTWRDVQDVAAKLGGRKVAFLSHPNIMAVKYAF